MASVDPLAIAIVHRAPTLPPGTITAIVRDRQTGNPLPNTVVMVEGTGAGALTDSAGWARIADVGFLRAAYTIAVHRMGYRPVRARVAASAASTAATTTYAPSAVVLEASLEPYTVRHHCRGSIPAAERYAVTLVVRDLATGRAPQGPVRAMLIDLTGSGYRDSTVVNGTDKAEQRAAGALIAQLGRERAGIYGIRASAPGYAEWSLDWLRAERESCGDGPRGERVPVWLIPTATHPR